MLTSSPAPRPGRVTAAKPFLGRALAIRERALGPDHPDTVSTRRALAEMAAEGDGLRRAAAGAGSLIVAAQPAN